MILFSNFFRFVGNVWFLGCGWLERPLSSKRMRLLVFLFIVCLGLGSVAESDAGALRVFRFLVDAAGRHALSPSLLDRDAYQAHLQEHPEEVGGLRFVIQWKRRRGETPAKPSIRVEVRHGDGNTMGEFSKSAPLKVRRTRRSQWHQITISGEEYARLGKGIAWRVSLWDGETRLAQAESFLW